VKAKKTIDEGKLIFKDFERNSGSNSTGKTVRVSLSSEEIGILNMEVRIHAPLIKDPTKFHAALLVDLVRIRGVDYNPLPERTRGFKTRIPHGWHQNIEYPNHPKDNRHVALDDLGIVTDLTDFSRKICRLWNIELPDNDKQTVML
jgi:hypothetical protein